MNEHPARDPSQKGDSSLGPENTPEAVSGGCYPVPAKSSSSLSAKFRRQKAKVVTALKSLTNSSSEQLVVVEQPDPPADEHEPKSTLISGIHRMSNAIFRPPLEPTVVRRTSPKSRPLLRETFRGAETPPEPDSGSRPTHTTASNTSSSKTSASNSNSGKTTQKALVESMFKTQDPNTVGRGGNRPRNGTPRPDPQRRATPPSTPRRTNINHPPSTPPRTTATRPNTPKTSNNKRATPINPISHLLHPYRLPTPAPTTPTKTPAPIHPPTPTSPLNPARTCTPTHTPTPTPAPNPATPTLTLTPTASIATAERAAAAKIFLETHFGKLLGPGPSPRQMRQQMLETELFNRNRVGGNGGGSGGGGSGGAAAAAAAAAAARARFWRRESEYLREMRVVKVRGLGMVRVGCGAGTGTRFGLGAESRSGSGSGIGNGVGEEETGGKGGMDGGGLSGYRGYETVSVLGKGSFGVVRLVRERGRAGRVYAMKVIRKSKMLRTSQEGHLRAERDILVASEGSRWIVPLVASFQDLTNLYLVMEYMPGGDFLSLLIRENILHESVARFYVAEIILCVEAAHSLNLVRKLGIRVDGDGKDRSEDRDPETEKRSSGITAAIARHDRKIEQDGEPLLSWRNRCGIRYAARSVVGTSQYMAPEVIEGRRYDARQGVPALLGALPHEGPDHIVVRFLVVLFLVVWARIQNTRLCPAAMCFPTTTEDIKAHNLRPPRRSNSRTSARLRFPLQSFALDGTIDARHRHHPTATGVDTKMRVLEAYLAQMTVVDATEAERAYLRGFVRRFGGAAGDGKGVGGDGEGKGGQRERRRPRDKLLRDRRTCAVAMEVRRRTAFLGYEWTRMRGEDDDGEDGKGGGGEVGGEVGAGGAVGLDGVDGGKGDEENRVGEGGYHGSRVHPHGEQQQQEKPQLRGGFRPWGDDVAVVRAMYSGPWSLRLTLIQPTNTRRTRTTTRTTTPPHHIPTMASTQNPQHTPRTTETALDIAADVIRLLRAAGETVGVAESLTAGGVMAALTSVPGASAVFRGGVVAYATPLKRTLLGVDAALIEREGVVHGEVAVQMAVGARRAATVAVVGGEREERERDGEGEGLATWGVGTTGVAGPGEQDGKAAGTVYIGIASPAGGEGVWAVLCFWVQGSMLLEATVLEAFGETEGGALGLGGWWWWC
ncbi:hypothetical protein CHGG_01886 [Chaetomium globosum CBS 148.51]|uniref:non-specific serine/threonine protein kinase n=1 Tax=Chaetomium globosum (strain ATCC 6205 / CBS 148.51 / DSM 1962 / NBRC 6347 / NRRL 1970) TaxID=306901 RepID=Q2HD18_CHAGB|nr:uncharacterized protein CHGG_01886 [Chaetomium globosum CBS 148.51]EAQ93651.1 hypothetical protein CHGG_01886 [Chaetomium globosum CBS 148.51]